MKRNLPLWEVTIHLCHPWPCPPTATELQERGISTSKGFGGIHTHLFLQEQYPLGSRSRELCPSHPIPREKVPADPSPPAAGAASWAVKLLFRSQIRPKFPSAAAAAGRNHPHLPGSRRSARRDGIDKIPGRHGKPACQTQPINVSPFPCQPIKLCVLVTSAGKGVEGTEDAIPGKP